MQRPGLQALRQLLLHGGGFGPLPQSAAATQPLCSMGSCCGALAVGPQRRRQDAQPPLLLPLQHQQHQQHQQPGAWAWCLGGVRGMAGRTHKLSLRRANNRASWEAVRPFLDPDAPQPGRPGPLPGQRQQQQQQQARPPPIATAIPELPRLDEPPRHRHIGRITGPYAVAPQAAFAVLESGGSQFKVTADDVIYHNRIPGVAVNDVVEFPRVLLVGTAAETTVGRPFVPGVSVVAAVEETLKDSKVWVFKKKKRKRYSRLKGHRSHVTVLRVLELRGPGVPPPGPPPAALAGAPPAGGEGRAEEELELRPAQPGRQLARRGPHGPPAVLSLLGGAPPVAPAPTDGGGSRRRRRQQQAGGCGGGEP